LRKIKTKLLNEQQILPCAPCLRLSATWSSNVLLFALLENCKLEFTSLSKHGFASALPMGLFSYVYFTVLKLAENSA
jgi:hypothetical protein